MQKKECGSPPSTRCACYASSAAIFAGYGLGMMGGLINNERFIFAVDNSPDCTRHLLVMRDFGWFPGLDVHLADCDTWDAISYQGRVDCLHASPPCPRWSTARSGKGDTYDGWPATLRITRQIRPRFLLLECVEGFAKEHDRVRDELSANGYSYQACVFDAASLGAPHSRRRYWGLAHANDQGQSMRPLDAEMAILPPPDCGFWETDPRHSGLDDGHSLRTERYRATGNGQVPIAAAFAARLLGMNLEA